MLLVLDVDADKYESLVDALGKRSHIRILPMDRAGRKNYVDCPCCKRRLSKESTFTINEDFVEGLTQIAVKMQVAKAVILVNKYNPISTMPPVEHARCVEIDPLVVSRAETLKLIKRFEDGSRLSYFVTAAGLAFLSGERPASPCSVTTLDGEVIETSGELSIEGVKFKDEIRAGTLKRAAADAVKSLPERVSNFVINGQMSLI